MCAKLQRKGFRENLVNGNSLADRKPSHEAETATGWRRTIGLLLFLVLLYEPAVAQDRASPLPQIAGGCSLGA